MFVDLINQISTKDKETMINYIDHFGVNKENFIGIDDFLRNWNHSKQNLYKLLGNNLIYSFPFEYQREQPDHSVFHR